MAEGRRRHGWHYRPGEMVVALELPEDSAQQRQAHGLVQQAIEQNLAGRTGGVFEAQQRRGEPIVVRAAGRPPLGFLFYNLADPEQHDFVKQVVAAIHANNLDALEPLRRQGMTPIGVMPHWLGSSQQGFNDGSPATLPRPIRRPRGRWGHRYSPQDRRLDFRGRLARQRTPAVPVLVLDTPPDWDLARSQAARFADVNGQLEELLRFLPDAPLPAWHAAELDARNKEALKLARTPDGRARGHDMSDHALFIAGLIHDLSPSSELHVRPVLNRYGVGDLHLLLLVLSDVLSRKPQHQPLIVNMSLGFMPKLEHLPWVWYGARHPNDPDFIPDVPIRNQTYDASWLAQNRDEVDRTRLLLQRGLQRLAEYLLANNCLAVAAAGNDSLRRVETGRPRLGPRVPARFETVLGVAATTRDPTRAAAYSNVGDDLELGDHIATFGGDFAPPDNPRNGVIGVYTARRFPRAIEPAIMRNSNGWAEWSGTSFATAIASGLVSGYWTLQRVRRPDVHAAEVLLEIHKLADNYAPALRTPSIEMSGEWQRMPG